jgi:hypothetical protein
MREQAWTAITKLIQSEFNFNQFLLKACSLRCRLYFLARRFHASAALRFVFFRLQNGAVQGVSSPARFLRHQTLLQCNRRRTQNACATACLQVPCKSLAFLSEEQGINPYERDVERAGSTCLPAGPCHCCRLLCHGPHPHCRAVTSSSWRTCSCGALPRGARLLFK